MASWQPYGYRGEPGTCLWCGRKLRRVRVMADEQDQDDPTYKAEGPGWATVQAATPGVSQNGHFDTQGCGFWFGVALADHGRRLMPVSS